MERLLELLIFVIHPFGQFGQFAIGLVHGALQSGQRFFGLLLKFFPVLKLLGQAGLGVGNFRGEFVQVLEMLGNELFIIPLDIPQLDQRAAGVIQAVLDVLERGFQRGEVQLDLGTIFIFDRLRKAG